MANVRLRFSTSNLGGDITEDFTNNFHESCAESKYLNQITHLKICNSKPQIGKRIDLLLKDKFNLEYLVIDYYELIFYPNLLSDGNYKNLKYLDIGRCQIKNQDFANIIVSPNLPNLETLKVDNWSDYTSNWNEIDNAVAVFPPNSQSSITELDITGFKTSLFPSLFDHCPKLKNLCIYPHELNELKSTNLSNLEVLKIVEFDKVEIMEDIFINPIYSNLKELFIYGGVDNVKFISKCTNLVNLTTLDLTGLCLGKSLIRECSKELKNNPTFAKLKHIKISVD